VSLLNQVAEFVKVIASSLGSTNGATLANVTGIDGGDEQTREKGNDEEMYQALGVIGRPLPPEGDAFAEALAVRTEDGFVPFAWRDLRLHRALNPSGAPTTPREGQLMFVGYGGAFLSHSMTDGNTGSKRGNVVTLYCPYDFDADGAPQKAHAIIIDPTDGNRAISIVHGSGLFFTMAEDTGSGPGIVASVDGSTFMRMSPGEFSVSAEKILLKGNCYLGRQAEAGAPLLPGIASPPCMSLYLSPV